jgi:hypothetical protein
VNLSISKRVGALDPATEAVLRVSMVAGLTPHLPVLRFDNYPRSNETNSPLAHRIE